MRGSVLDEHKSYQEDVRGVQRNPVASGEFGRGVFGEGCFDAHGVQRRALEGPRWLQSSPSEALHPRQMHRRGGRGGRPAREGNAAAAAAGDTSPLHPPLHLRRNALRLVL